MSYKKATCVDYCDGREARKTYCPVEDKTEKARTLLCSLTFKHEVEAILEIICNLKVSMRSDLDQQVLEETAKSGHPTENQCYPSDATCLLVKELKAAIDRSLFIKYVPDIDGCPVWYFIFLTPHHCPIKGDLPCDDLIRRKIVAIDTNVMELEVPEVSLFSLCKEGSKGYIKYPTEPHPNHTVVTYQQALGELERLLNLSLEANNLVCHN